MLAEREKDLESLLSRVMMATDGSKGLGSRYDTKTSMLAKALLPHVATTVDRNSMSEYT